MYLLFMLLERMVFCFVVKVWSRYSFLWWLANAAGRHMGRVDRHMGLPLLRHHTTAIGSILHGLGFVFYVLGAVVLCSWCCGAVVLWFFVLGAVVLWFFVLGAVVLSSLSL